MDSPARLLFTSRKGAARFPAGKDASGPHQKHAFSLVEVVLALGLCVFVLVTLIGLFQVGLKSGKESEDQVQAANLASQIIAVRAAAPSKDYSTAPIPAAALKSAFADAYAGAVQYVGFDGQLRTSSASAAYRITCTAGTTTQTGSRTAQIYLVLTWPPQAQPANAEGRYEILTWLPLY